MNIKNILLLFIDGLVANDPHTAWLGLHLDTSWDGDATAIIAFDPIWNQIGVGRTPLTSKWPILLIRFPAISAINLSEYKDVGGVQRGIAGAESKKAGNEETKTIISDHYGGQVIIVHQDPVRVLCFTATGESIELKA